MSAIAPMSLQLPTEPDVAAAGADDAFLGRYREFLNSLRLSRNGDAIAADYELAGGASEFSEDALVGARLLAALLQPDDALCREIVEGALGLKGYTGPPESLPLLLDAQTTEVELADGEIFRESPYPRDWPKVDEAIPILEAFLSFRESPVYACFGTEPTGGSPLVSVSASIGFPAISERLQVWPARGGWALVTSALWETRVLPHALGFIASRDVVWPLMSLLEIVSKDGNPWWDKETNLEEISGLDVEGRAMLDRFVASGGKWPWRRG